MVGLMVMYHSGIIRKQKKQTKANKCQYLGIQIFLPQKFASAKMAGESLITVVGFENRRLPYIDIPVGHLLYTSVIHNPTEPPTDNPWTK